MHEGLTALKIYFSLIQHSQMKKISIKIWDKLEAGGMLYIDDYGFSAYPRLTELVTEFANFVNQPMFLIGREPQVNGSRKRPSPALAVIVNDILKLCLSR